MELAAEPDALALGLDAANAIKARDSIEQMLAHQTAAAHKVAMRFLAKADHHLSKANEFNLWVHRPIRCWQSDGDGTAENRWSKSSTSTSLLVPGARRSSPVRSREAAGGGRSEN
jgi:hypothetical protein